MGKALIYRREAQRRTGICEGAKGFREKRRRIYWSDQAIVGHLVTMSYPDAYDPGPETLEHGNLPFLPKIFKHR